MNKVFFDLEWNTGFLDGNSFDEIIEIGAVKTDEEYRQIDGFRRLIRPVIYRKMNPYIQKILAITMKDLQGEEPLASVAKAFFDWCGDQATFFTWGPSDARVLELNLVWYGLGEYLPLEVYDLQRAFDLMIMGSDQQTALKDAVETLGLEEQLEFHDACNDAFYTACIGAEMIRRLGELPSRRELERREQELYRQRREQAARTAVAELDRIFAQEQPLLERDTVRREVELFRAHPDRIVGLGHNGVRGNPCIFPRRFFPELMALTGDVGGNVVIRAHPESLLLCETAAAELRDVDTVEALAAIRTEKIM